MKKKNIPAPSGAYASAPAAPEEQTYPITIDGQTIELTLEQLLRVAEQALSGVNEEARQGGNDTHSDGGVYQSFLKEYPDIQPDEIPQEVWDSANQSGDLLRAYRTYEIQKLRQELEDSKKNADNRRLDVGSARSDGANTITDPIILALMGRG